MHCFYIETPTEALALLSEEEAKHAVKVLRLRPGDRVCAMDGAGRRWDACLERISEDGVMLRLADLLPDNEPPVRVTVYQGLPKADKMEYIVQKLTELGAAVLAPVTMDRCVVKPDGWDSPKRLQRLERIAREAAKQCRRAYPLQVLPLLTWRQALERLPAHDAVLVPWEDAADCRIKDVYADRPGVKDIGIVVGSEGGMSESEVRALTERGALAVTLGPRILRTETASVVSAALVMQLWGDL